MTPSAPSAERGADRGDSPDWATVSALAEAASSAASCAGSLSSVVATAQPAVAARAAELCATFLQRRGQVAEPTWELSSPGGVEAALGGSGRCLEAPPQGLPARGAAASLASPSAEAGASATATGSTAALEGLASELLLLSRGLLALSREVIGRTGSEETTANRTDKLRRGGHRIAPEVVAMPAASFLWPLLPPFLERPTHVAALAGTARGPHQALCWQQRISIGHVHLHPNSLGPSEARVEGSMDFKSAGCLEHLHFGALVSVQFHLPRLSEAMWLLNALAQNPCYSLRKVIDRQSRWRPREQRFDSLDPVGRLRAAELARALEGKELRSLRHLEGPIFAVLLRALGQEHTGTQEGEPDAALHTVSPPWAIRVPGDTASRFSAEWRAAARTPTGAAVPPAEVASPLHGSPCSASSSDGLGGFGERLEVAHLVDAAPEDLHGLWEPVYPKLQKLVLLNLPAAQPGRTASAVADFLVKAPSLTELQLDFQFFDATNWDLDALEALVERVQMPPSKVAKFILDWCRLGDSGVRRVCQTFAKRPSGAVTELSLAHSELRDVGSICEMLETPELSLTRLDLSSNALDDRQAARLAKAIPHSKLKELRLRDSLISSALPVKTEWFWGC